MSAEIQIQETDVVVRLRPGAGGLVTASELLEFARVAVANAGPDALLSIGWGLNVHRSFQRSGS